MPPNDALNIAICGLGARGLEHARAIRKVDSLALCGLFDISPIARLGASHATGVAVFEDLAEMLRACQPAIVVIATPPSERLSLVEQLAAAESVRGLLIEKPLALDLPEARRIFNICRSRRLALRIGHQLRFSPEFVRLKRAIQDGDLGELRNADVSCYGNLLDQGPHMLDMLCWLLEGRRPVSVEAEASNDLPAIARIAPIRPEFIPSNRHPAPHAVQARIVFEGGMRATLTAGLLAPMQRPALGPWMQKRVRLEGSQGTAEAHVGSHFWIADARHPGGLTEASSLEAYTDATGRMHADFAASVRAAADGEAIPPGYDTVVDLLFGCLHSSLTGQAVTFPMKRDVELQAGSGRAASSAAPMAPAAGSPWSGPPRLSVIVSMAEHRGLGSQAVEAWANGQRCDAGLYEVLLILDERVSDGLAAEFRARLRPWDRCLRAETLVETEQYVMAARQARGEYLFFAEAHVLPEPQAVEESIRFLDTHDYAGLCVRSSPIPGNRFAYNETRQLRELFVEWSRPGNFAKVLARGFCIRTRVYWELGGHQHRYHRFADAIMAATLKQRGYELAYAPAVGVNHLDEQEFSGLDYSIRNFVTGEAMWRAEASAEVTQLFFGEPPEWIEARSFRPRLVRHFCRILLREITRPAAGLSVSFRLLGGPAELLRVLPQAIFGGRWLLLSRRLRWIVCRLRYYLWSFDAERRYQAYVDWYAAGAAFYRVKFALEHPPAPAGVREPALEYAVESLASTDSAGFHAPENHQGTPFRWTATIAALRLRVKPGAYELTLHTNGVRRARARHLALDLDGRRVGPVQFNEDSTTLRVRLPESAFDGSDDHWLSIVCPPLKEADVRGPNRRLLGLPIIAVKLTPVTGPAAHSARS